MSQQNEPEPKKQIKIRLTTNEHAVVSLAANLKKTTMTEYMTKAIMKQAKVDARAINEIIEEF